MENFIKEIGIKVSLKDLEFKNGKIMIDTKEIFKMA